MGIATIILVVLGVLTLLAVAGYYSWKQEMKRREALMTLALELGWAFDHHKDRSFDDRFRGFGAFRRGGSRFAYNRLSGPVAVRTEDGDPLELQGHAGDYHYTVTSGSGKNRSTTTYRFSYLLIQAPIAGCDLAVRPENIGDKLAAAIGFDDIDFESVEFSDRFHVKSRDKRFAYDVLHPRMMEFLLSGPTPTIEIRDGVLLLTGGNSRWNPREFRMRIDWAAAFYALWPRHLTAN